MTGYPMPVIAGPQAPRGSTGQFVVPGAAEGGIYREDGSALDRLVAKANAHEQALSAGTVRRTGRPDALARVRGNARPALERVNAEWDRKMAADREDPDRKFLTPEGLAHRDAVLKRMREEAVDAVAAPFLRELEAAEREVAAERDRVERPPVTRQDFDDASAVARHLRELTPSVGIAQAAEIIADAAGTPTGSAVVRELLPHLRSLHDGPGAYHGSDDLKVLLHQSERLLAGPERELAEHRAGLLERTRWSLGQLIDAARTGDAFALRTLTSDGEGGERATLLGDEPVAAGASEHDFTRAWGDGSFRRISSKSDKQRAADEAALAENG